MKNIVQLSTEDKLILSLDAVLIKKKQCSFSDLVVESFTKYPESFSLAGYKQFPDTLKLDRPLRSLRAKKMISGSSLTYFSLTRFGVSYVKSINSSNQTINIQPLSKNTARNADLIALKKISYSKDFNDYKLQKHNFIPNGMRIRELMSSTMETSKKDLVKKLQYIEQSAKDASETDIQKYISVYLVFLSA